MIRNVIIGDRLKWGESELIYTVLDINNTGTHVSWVSGMGTNRHVWYPGDINRKIYEGIVIILGNNLGVSYRLNKLKFNEKG